jgi:hypothetical protein
MTRFQQEILRPGSYELEGGRTRTFTAGDLRTFAANTRAMLARGYRVPLLARHAAAGSPEGEPRPPSPAAGRGHKPAAEVGALVDLWQQGDGALVAVIDVPGLAESEAIALGRTRHTSPELRGQFIDRQGNRFGPVISHLALTNHPRHVERGPLAPLSPSSSSSTSCEPLLTGTFPMTHELLPPSAAPAASGGFPLAGDRPANESTDFGGASGPAVPAADSSSPLPDEEPAQAPPQEPPEEDTDIPATDALPAERAPPDGDAATETAAPPSPEVAAAAELADTAAAEADAERRRRQEQYRGQLASRIRRSRRLPKGLRDQLAQVVETVQLSRDGDEEPVLRVSHALAMLEQTLPATVALADENLERPGHPLGETFFTGDAARLSDEEAERIAGEQLASAGFARRKR